MAIDASCTSDALTVVLDDGRTVSVPLAWFPRLLNASEKQRKDWEFIGGGVGIHWEAINEDISITSLLNPEKFMRLTNHAMEPTPRGPHSRRASARLIVESQTESRFPHQEARGCRSYRCCDGGSAEEHV